MKRKSGKERIPVLKRIEIIIPHDKLADAHNVLKDANVGGISHYRIEGSGRVKADPVVAATHPTHPHGYVERTKVEVVVKDEQVIKSSIQITWGTRSKNICCRCSRCNRYHGV